MRPLPAVPSLGLRIAEGLPSILVVCEGRETEPNYIDGLREHLRINSAAVYIDPGASATDPVGLVRKAQQLFKGDRDYDLGRMRRP